MKTKFFYISIFFMLLFATSASSQCQKVSLIGAFNEWNGDFYLDRNLDNPDEFSAIFALQDSSELKFRAGADWGTNWGSDDGFPTGVGVPDGSNLSVPPGTYLVTFNCVTGAYNFQATCGEIGIVGAFSGWGGEPDASLNRDADNPDMWSGIFTLVDSSELKFRQDADWGVNWGSDDNFPTGTAVQDGANLSVPPGTYMVTFNCATGAYNFETTCGEIGIVGAFSGWGGEPDAALNRDANNPNMWSGLFTLVDSSELKFRMNADWTVNWGSDDGFPTGVGVQNGTNLSAPPGTYHVIFNCATGDYSFLATCGDVSMIGAFIGWNGDIPMNRDAANPQMWNLTRAWNLDSEVKFRQNRDWAVNWGDGAWPSGTATDNGTNIPLVAGKYDISFNCTTGDYNFADNTTDCGEIGMIGDFNAWGESNADGFPTDAFMVRDANHPGQYSMTYTFSGATKLLFRMDGDESYTEVWGGTFPSGTGIKNPSSLMDVPGGNYYITFNCLSGDFNFVRLGSSIDAPKVFALNVDGNLSEKDWNVTEPISKIVSGENADVNGVFLGTAYNDEFFYIGISVSDAELLALDGVAIGLDGDNSGGALDEHDISFAVGASGAVIVSHGPTPTAVVGLTADGYQVEIAIAWADLGVTPVEGTQVKMDAMVNDEDADGSTIQVWNGTGVSDPSSFGGINLAGLSCGDITLYSDNLGDINLRPLTDDQNTYVGTYELEADNSLVFRKDGDNTVTWGAGAFPSGTATVGGDMIPATTGRYRVSFGCQDGTFSFTEEVADATVAYAQYESITPVIDGDLGEYDLDYGMDAGVVVGGAGANNNTVAWGASWDEDYLYLAASVTDGTVEGSGNPWDNDAIEWYIDGNHDSDGPFDGDFDTQLIMDYVTSADGTVWAKADGAPIDSSQMAGSWVATNDGYNVEMRLAWEALGFVPGRNRTIGFTIGNNDSDGGVGRDYQTAWVGTGDNWNNTALHGDLQLAGGDLFYSGLTKIFYNNEFKLFPNPVPSSAGFNVISDSEMFDGNINIYIFNMMGQKVSNQELNFNANTTQHVSTNNLTSGAYIVQFTSKDGKVAVKKIIVE